MMRIVEALSRIFVVSPSILNAGESCLIKRDRALRHVSSPENPRMIEGDPGEYDDRQRRPPGRKDVIAKRKPCHYDERESHDKPEVSELDVALLIESEVRLSHSESLHVFFGRKHWLRM